VSLKRRLAGASRVPTDEGLASWTSNGDSGGNGRPKTGLKVTKMSDVTAEDVQWLWSGWLAVGKCHLMVGQPDIGKSFVSTSFASTITIGGKFPDGSRCPTTGEVLFLAGEDGKADTIRPRLDAHGADASKVFVIDGQQIQDGEGKVIERGIRLDVDIADIDQFLADHPDVRVWFIDPISEFLGRADSHKDADVRQILGPLAGLAEKYRVAIVYITHFNKSNVGPALYHAMGSLAFAAQVRVAFGFIRDYENEDRVLVLPLKNNIHRKVPGRVYRLIDDRVEWEPDGIHVTADEALDPPKQARGDKLAEVVECLKQRLSAGCVDADTLDQDALDAGISKSTLQRARKVIGVVSTKSRLEWHG